jgi:hypothetical protein
LRDAERGAIADAEGPRKKHGVRRRGSWPFDDEDTHDLRGREHEVKDIVHRKAILGCRYSDTYGAPVGRVRHGDGCERHGRRSARRQRDALRLHFAAVELERHACVGDGTVALPRESRRNDGAIDRARRVARDVDARHQHVRGRRVTDIDSRDRRRRGHPRQLLAIPTRALKVADHHDFATRTLGTLEKLLRDRERRSVARAACTRMRVPKGGSQHGRVARWPGRGDRLVIEEHQRCSIGCADPRDRTPGRGGCTRPAITIGHAVRAVEQDHHLTRPCARGAGVLPFAIEERARERRSKKNQRETTQSKEHPVSNALPAYRAEGHASQEHQRRKRDGVAALPIHEVHDDGYRHREEAEQEKGSKKGETHRVLLRRWRSAR